MEATQVGGFLLPPGSSECLNVFGVKVEVLLTGDETNGAFSVYRVEAEPGGGPPPHVHSLDDEAFHIIEGEFEILLGEKTQVIGAGSFVFLPRNIPHAFRNVGSSTGRLIGMATPAGHEKFFYDANQLPFPPNPQDAIEVCRRHGMELLMAPPESL